LDREVSAAPPADEEPARDTSAAEGERRSRSEALGALAVSGSNIIRFSIQLALLPILARLIGPEEYGLVALAIPFVLFCNIFSDGGLGVALARQQNPSREMESTVFWIAGGVGLALALVFCVLAWPISQLLKHPQLPPLIIALSPIMVMSGLTAAANARIIRNGLFAVFAGSDLISVVGSSLVAVTAAAHGWGAWSIVAQQLTLWSLKLAWVQFGSKLRVSFVCRPREVVDLLRFGGNTVGAGLADFATRNLDKLIIGGVLGALPLGYYAMAYQIIRVPDYVVSGPFYLFVFSRIARGADPEAFPRVVQIATASIRSAVITLGAIFGGLAMVAHSAVPVILGPDWTGAISSLQWLSLAGFGFSMSYVFGAILVAAGRAEQQLRVSIAGSVLTVVAVTATAHLGLGPVACAVAAATLAMVAIYLRLIADYLRIRVWAVMAMFVAPALGVAGMAIVVRAVSATTTTLPSVLQLALLVVVGAVAYVAVLAATARRRLQSDLRLLLTDTAAASV
jgi:O-antigen/teichoic acid export membrane protein